MPFDQNELSLILNAIQGYKLQQERQLSERNSQGYDTSEQAQRIQMLDDIEEKLFEILD